MPKYFIMGDRQMMYLHDPIVNHPDFGGFISESAKNLDYEQKSLAGLSNKFISFLNFLRFARVNGAVLVLYYSDIAGARLFAEHARSLADKFNFVVQDYYEFVVERNFALMYETASENRRLVLSRKDQWVALSRRLTDQFSQSSVLAYISGLEKKSMLELIPFVTPFAFEGYNKYSRRFSFVPTDDEIYVDIGAYDGDTVTKFIECTPSGRYDAIHAFEPNPKTYQALERKKEWIPRLNTYRMALSDNIGQMEFRTEGGSMGARFASGGEDKSVDTELVDVVRLDSVLDRATIIKIDVEGFEDGVVRGAAGLLKAQAPNLVVDTYHYANDALKIYDEVMSIHPYKYVSMRFCHANFFAHSLYFSDRSSLE